MHTWTEERLNYYWKGWDRTQRERYRRRLAVHKATETLNQPRSRRPCPLEVVYHGIEEAVPHA